MSFSKVRVVVSSFLKCMKIVLCDIRLKCTLLGGSENSSFVCKMAGNKIILNYRGDCCL